MGPKNVDASDEAAKSASCRELLAKFDEDGEDFLRQIVTGDGSWVHHNDPESKQQLKEYRHHLRKNSKCFLPHGRCFSQSFGTVRMWFTQNFWNKATP